MLGGKGKEGSLPTVFPKVSGSRAVPCLLSDPPIGPLGPAMRGTIRTRVMRARWLLTHFGPEPRPLVTGPGADSEIWFKERRFVRLAGPRAGDMGGECMPLGEGRTPG